jgi:tyrosyl-tRNA synthetase
MDLLADLDARGLIHDATDRAALHAALSAGPVTLYHGIDPTADSLHSGNLIGLVMLRRFLDAGHRPIALAGGATGMVGDPSGRSSERNLLDEPTLRANVAAIKQQITAVLGEDGAWELVDNYDWTSQIGVLDFLRDVGKHATVNAMLARESVKQRMQADDGISFTEFAYMLLQANDYLWLHDNRACTLQVGGSDQWGNILSGVDLIRRTRGVAVHAMAWPLLTAADGSKLGKTTGARLWLDPRKTLPYDFYQHWLGRDDAEIGTLLKWFTTIDVAEIDEIMAAHTQDPSRRVAQRTLAAWLTELVHGAEEAARVQAVDPKALDALEGAIATTHVAPGSAGRPLTELFTETGLAASKSAAARLVAQGGAYVNDEQVQDPDLIIDESLAIEGRVLLRAGKKKRHLLVFTPSS